MRGRGWDGCVGIGVELEFVHESGRGERKSWSQGVGRRAVMRAKIETQRVQ